MAIQIDLSDEEFIGEVRTMMADLGDKQIPDDTITQQRDRFVLPELDEKGAEGIKRDIETAAIAYTAELSFKSWLKKNRMASDEMTATFDIEAYRQELEDKAQMALGRVGIEHQPDEESPVAFVDSSEGWL